MDEKKIIAQNLKILRKEKKLTQKELAHMVGISYKSITNYENAYRIPKSSQMHKLALFFDVSEAFIRGETQNRKFDKQNELIAENVLDHSIEVMFKNICYQIDRSDEQTKNRFYQYLVEMQRLFNYDTQITSLLLESAIHNTYATTRLTDVILQCHKCDDITFIHVQKIFDMERKNVDKSLNDLFLYLIDLKNKK